MSYESYEIEYNAYNPERDSLRMGCLSRYLEPATLSRPFHSLC